MRFKKRVLLAYLKHKISTKKATHCGKQMLVLFYKFLISTDLLKSSEMELENYDDLGRMIVIYCAPEMDNPSPIKLFTEIVEPKLVQFVIPSYNIPIPCPYLKINPKVLATIEDSHEGSDNEEQSHYGNKDFSDPNLDDIREDIDDQCVMEGEDIHPYSAGSMRYDIVICNNPGAFMTDVHPGAAVACEFSEYPNIVSSHLLDEESKARELFVGQQFDNKKDCLHTIK
ncbi:hypothetical protein J1N35_015351 [Gossypium stocksii]|uniref:Uncharacterized protein n=1 Tax=Gossypium stocksii TaxID=47602 RepID=A0A9D3VWS5_9ROSI|nr:hypothetical protein J1N35_015351 [Gossypium stocksii]